MGENTFFDEEVIRLTRELSMDKIKCDIFKEQFARDIQEHNKADIIQTSMMISKKYKKPFKIRLSEFLNRLKNTF